MTVENQNQSNYRGCKKTVQPIRSQSNLRLVLLWRRNQSAVRVNVIATYLLAWEVRNQVWIWYDITRLLSTVIPKRLYVFCSFIWDHLHTVKCQMPPPPPPPKNKIPQIKDVALIACKCKFEGKVSNNYGYMSSLFWPRTHFQKNSVCPGSSS